MATPTQKHTKSRKRVRRSVLKIKSAHLVICPKCKKKAKSHMACSFCGTYKGKLVIKLRVAKKFRKKKQKEEKNK